MSSITISPQSRRHNSRLKAGFLPCLLVSSAMGEVQSPPLLAEDDFESGPGKWALLAADSAAIRVEPGTNNHVLELRAKKKHFSHILLKDTRNYRNVRIEGRFLFPTEGDGYLGFIYNHQLKNSRTDFGCIYIKSNGNYLRVSPHYDGNPSWRLYEEMRVDLIEAEKISPLTWYSFRLDVNGTQADFFLGDTETATVSFDQFPNQFGSIGFEARPLGGEDVWIDDIRVSELPPAERRYNETAVVSTDFYEWEVQNSVEELLLDTSVAPDLPPARWRRVDLDKRGALITGAHTQFVSGDETVLFVRMKFDSTEGSAINWLAVSTANEMDIWLNGRFKGTVARERFARNDYLTSSRHPGARIPIDPIVGINEVLIRLHGKTFAGGGFFASLQSRASQAIK